VTFTTSVEPREAKAGETVTYKVTAKLDTHWHIFKYKNVKPDEDAESYTVFDFFDPAGLTLRGEWTASREPTKNNQAAAVGSPPIDYFENEVTWSISMVVPPGTEPGKKTLRNQAGFQVCNAGNCSIPGHWTLPDAELTVIPGGALASATAPPASDAGSTTT
jgi:hypothetical protein